MYRGGNVLQIGEGQVDDFGGACRESDVASVREGPFSGASAVVQVITAWLISELAR